MPLLKTPDSLLATELLLLLRRSIEEEKDEFSNDEKVKMNEEEK